MDKRLAILALTSTNEVIPINSLYAKEIADFIDQQEKQINELKTINIEFANITAEYVGNGYKLADAVEQVEIENRNLKIERDELLNKVDQQLKYAELGRLAVKTQGTVCKSSLYNPRPNACKKHCKNFNYCQKRAELLANKKD